MPKRVLPPARPARLVGTLALFACLLATANAQAFSVPNHEKITRHAQRLHAQCFGESPGGFPVEAKLLKGVRAQGRGFSQVFNRHNFDRKDELFNLLIHRSLDRTFKRRSRMLHRMLRRVSWGFTDRRYKRLSRATGAVMHYIQDVHSPVRVIPVNVRNNDPFERYWEDDENRPAFAEPADARCQQLADRVNGLDGICEGKLCTVRRLLQVSAESTWKVLDGSIASTASPSWRTVWIAEGERSIDGKKCVGGKLLSKPSKDDEAGAYSRGFGCYGVPFGDVRGVGPARADRDAFFTNRFQAAVDASAVLLAYVARKIGAKGDPREQKPQAPVEPGESEEGTSEEGEASSDAGDGDDDL